MMHAARTTTTSTPGRAPPGGVARGASREGRRARRRDGAPGRPEGAAPLPVRQRPHHGGRHGRGRRGKLGGPQTAIRRASARRHSQLSDGAGPGCAGGVGGPPVPGRRGRGRSEERRVGKEGRSRWSAYHLKKKKKSR